MGSRYYMRPENAISKAEEFMKVGKPAKALDTLYDVIKSKKRNHNYSEKLIEEIMYKYLELCVDLKKSHVAKEGLFQYRNMCQAVNVASLASVVQGYLNMAEKRTDAARQESVDKVEVDDLDNLATPEMIMLSAVSGEGAQDRSDRTILMPWVKFLWESYCQCLELLRANSRVERLYHTIAQQAFKFCLKYQRKTEFRKLCDKLRNHLDLIVKQTNPSATSINLNNSDTQQMNLDTRIVQLDAAINMELWQEAYKAVEDINSLMSLSKKVFQPKMMANYYQKLALVFWKSGNYLFHAAAVFKYFQLTREMKKNISSDELARMASRVLAACLCAPLPNQHPEFDRFIETDRSPAEKMARLALLLALSQPPTRTSLLKDCVRFGVVSAASPEMQDLYRCLEVDFNPLNLCKKVDDRLKNFDDSTDFTSLGIYVEPLREMTLVRLLKQVAQVYQSLSMSRLLELAHFTTHYHMERIIVECARNNHMQVRIDHRTRSIQFGTDLTESQRTDLPEGPHVQSMPSEQIRTQLMQMMVVLDKSLKVVEPDRNKGEMNELRTRIVETYHASKAVQHQRLLSRRDLIERRKEYLEKCNNDLAQERQKAIELKEKEKKKREEARLKQELEEREKRRRENEIKDIQAKHTLNKINQLKNTEVGKKVLDKLDEEEIAKMNDDEIMARQVEEIEREKRELQSRLRAQEKRIDHVERAKRLEEIPLLTVNYELQKAERKQVWEEQELERIEKEKHEREADVENKARLVRMREDKDKYLEGLLKERKNVFEKKLQEFETMVKAERAVRLAQRKEERKEERRQKWLREKQEEEQRRRDEEAKRRREEEERLLEEKKQKEAEEYERRQRERDAQAEKARQREAEIEEKRAAAEASRLAKERSEAAAAKRGHDDGGSWRRGDGGAPPPPESEADSDRNRPWKGKGSWRDKERSKVDSWGPRKTDDGGPRDRDRDDQPPPPSRQSRGPTDGKSSWRTMGGDDRGPRRESPRGGDRSPYRPGGFGGDRDKGYDDSRRDDRRDMDRRDDRRDYDRRDDRRDMERRGDDRRFPDRRDDRRDLDRRDDRRDFDRRDRDEDRGERPRFGGGGGRDDRDRGDRDLRSNAPESSWRGGGGSGRDNPRDEGPRNWRSDPPRGGDRGGPMRRGGDDMRRDDRRESPRRGDRRRGDDDRRGGGRGGGVDSDGFTTVQGKR